MKLYSIVWLLYNNLFKEPNTVEEEGTYRGDELDEGEEVSGVEVSRQVESATLIMHSEQILYTIEYWL